MMNKYLWGKVCDCGHKWQQHKHEKWRDFMIWCTTCGIIGCPNFTELENNK